MRLNIFIAALAVHFPLVAFAQPQPTPTPTEPPAEPPPPVVAPAPAPTPTVTPAPVPTTTPAEPAKPGDEAKSDEAKITVGGYLEAFYQAHIQNPSNHITNLRHDNRSRTFTIPNVALDVKGVKGPVTTHVVLQVGHMPTTYYSGEPVSPGANGANTSDGELWKYVQTATVSVAAPKETTIEAGLFLSPIGLEVVPVKDNWNWSRSNLFFALPSYHTGVTVSHPLGGGWSGKFHVYNGVNSVVDNNVYPSVALSAGYTSTKTTAQFLYYGGIERATGAPEGKPWRHLFDALVQTALTDELSVAGQVDGGFEPNDIGTSSWIAVAGYLKYQLSSKLYAGLRGDFFYEKVAEGGGMTASSIFWPVKWVAEGTATLSYQPFDNISVRLEYRHDQADDNAYFGGTVDADPMSGAFVPNRKTQDTALLGVTAWF